MSKRTIFCLSIALLITAGCVAQNGYDQWTFSAKKISDKVYEVHYNVKINSPWHIYSQFMEDGGPLPTTFYTNKNPILIIGSKPTETGKAITKHEDVFDMDVKYFEGSVDFVQHIKKKRMPGQY